MTKTLNIHGQNKQIELKDTIGTQQPRFDPTQNNQTNPFLLTDHTQHIKPVLTAYDKRKQAKLTFKPFRNQPLNIYTKKINYAWTLIEEADEQTITCFDGF